MEDLIEEITEKVMEDLIDEVMEKAMEEMMKKVTEQMMEKVMEPRRVSGLSSLHPARATSSGYARSTWTVQDTLERCHMLI